MSTIYLNGEYLPADEAKISVNDRGFLFGDGFYEVTAAYRGNLFCWDRHMARARRGAAHLRIDFDPATLEDMHHRLLEMNGLADEEVSYVYFQVTRGVAPRTHQFPDPPVPPTVYAYANVYKRPPREVWEKGCRAITLPDVRWHRNDLKTIALLANCLARQAAFDAGVDETIQVRDGIAIEGAHSNLHFVFDGTVVTHPSNHLILSGVTRDVMFELAEELGIPVELRSVTLDEMWKADEVFFTGTTVEVRPAVEVDGRPVGDGKVGPVARALFDAFLAYTGKVGQGG